MADPALSPFLPSLADQALLQLDSPCLDMLIPFFLPLQRTVQPWALNSADSSFFPAWGEGGAGFLTATLLLPRLPGPPATRVEWAGALGGSFTAEGWSGGPDLQAGG